MKRKFLEDMGLEKEQVDKILDENSQDIGKAKGDSEKIQKDLDAANAEVESLKGQISDRDKQLETLKNYVIEIINPVEYASYVEFGHRTANHKGWVNGRFMLTISEQEIQQAAPAIIEKKLMKQMGELFT